MFSSLINRLTSKLRNFILQTTHSQISDKEFLEREIQRWESSPERIMQIKGFLYYANEHDILSRKRTMISKDGELETVDNLPNNHIIDNQYAKLVNQKTNYLFGQPIVVDGENKQYVHLLQDVFDRGFMRTLKNSGKYAYNGGIAWLYPFYTDEGKFSFRLFPAYDILPFWQDGEHSRLEAVVRMYMMIGYQGTVPEVIKKVEVYDLDGVHRFVYNHGSLVPDIEDGAPADVPHVTLTDRKGQITGFNWLRVPMIPVKCNSEEIPLLKRVKSLQDGINVMLSDFENNMQEDARNTILVLKNYDGTDLGEFRKNLATYGAVKVRNDDSAKGGVETLEITVNADNYKVIIDIFKKALIENGMGYDAKDDRLSGNPNQMNIQSMYSDIDNDADDTETEYQAAFEDILFFVNAHLANTGHGDFDSEKVDIIFNRDVLINESETISNCQKSLDILSLETVLGQHPWVDDVQKELGRLEAQRKKELEELEKQYDPFKQAQPEPGEEDKDGGLDGNKKP